MTNKDKTNSARTTQKIFAEIDDQMRDMKLSLATSSRMPATEVASESKDKDRTPKQKLATITEQVENTNAVHHNKDRITSTVYSRSELGDYSDHDSSVDEEVAKFEAWLERGSRTASSSDSGSMLTLSAFPMVEARHTPTKLSLFPKVFTELHRPDNDLPSTPLSPLNNGRDIYGNYIATNSNDYFTSRSPLLLPRAQLDNVIPMPRLRGGSGSWWENLGMQSKTSKATAANNDNQRPAKDLLELPRNPKFPIQNSRIRKSIPISAGTRPLTNMLSNYGRTDIPVRGGPGSPGYPPASLPTNAQYIDSGHVMSDLVPPPRLFISQSHAPSAGSDQSFTTIASYDRAPRLDKKWDKQSAHNPPVIPPPPPIPEKSTRRSQALFIAGPSDTQSYLSKHQRRTLRPDDSFSQRQPSPPPTTSDVASIQFGESASSLWARLPEPPRPHPRPTPTPAHHRLQHPAGMHVAPGGGPTEEDIDRWTIEAENKFRVVAHEIMTRYSKNKTQIWQALQRDEIGQMLYDRDLRNLEEKLQRDLKEAERVTGYEILNDEAAIAQAIETSNGYTIYQEILQPTQPELWNRLDIHSPHHTDQPQPQPLLHQRYSTNHLVTGMPFKPPKSSLGQSIAIAGKIARLLFAAPSDPELKTFSNRRPMGVSLAAVGGVSSGLTDISRAREERHRRREARKEVLGSLGGKKNEQERKVYKGKDRAVDADDNHSQAQSQSGIGIQDLASSATASRAGAQPPYPQLSHLTHAPSSATRYTGTTATPSTIYNTTESHRLFLDRPYSTFRHYAGDTENAVDAATNITSWPEADSQGNWADADRPVLRGGEKESVWQRMRVRKERKMAVRHGEGGGRDEEEE